MKHRIAWGGMTAEVAARGAELCSFCDDQGREAIWQAGPVWPRHAPVLFPIVGRLTGDTLRHAGQAFPMTQHGFARDCDFQVERQEADSVSFVLADDDATRRVYPFAFRLGLGFALSLEGLTVTYTVDNPGSDILPFSAGAHPAFCWPLREGAPKEAYSLAFERPEPAPLRALANGLILDEPRRTPIRGNILSLHPSVFDADALILDAPASRSVRYSAPGGGGLTVSWEGFPQLGIWSRAGGDFVCVEPWHGMASPVGFDGEFADKPGLVHLPPGEQWQASYRVSFDRR